MNAEVIKNFITAFTGVTVKNILSIKLKDYDDNHGPIGKHYIVDAEIDTGEHKNCFVNREALDNYETKNVVWIKE